MQTRGRKSLPDDQRELLAAFGRFLHSATEAILPAGQQIDRGPAAFVLYAVFLRLIQLGRALLELCAEGHAGESQTLSRAMISAALDILLIAEADQGPRALLFALFQGKVRRQRFEAMVKHHIVSQARADELEAKEAATDTAALKAQATAGAVPAEPLGKKVITWSGLSDFAVAKRFGLESWYDLYYSPFSDAAHVNAAAIDKEIGMLVAKEITVGQRFDSPWFVVLAATEAASHGAAAMDRYFGLGAAVMLESADELMMDALRPRSG